MAEDQVVGTARVDIVVGADGVEVGTNKAKNFIKSMSQEAQAEYQKLTRSEKNRYDALLKNADQLGMTRSQQLAYNATLKTSGALHDEVIKRIRAHEAAQVSDNAALDMGYRSHKQLQQAMRGTPAQISDIVVSLQGGQRPMTVFLQQGLQLRDMFGSWKQVAAGAGSAVVGMVNPMTIAATAVGVLFAAWHSGQKEAQAFNKAIVMSGNVAGLSAGELQTMARQVGEITGTQREASAVLAQMAGSANIAKEGMVGYAETAINLNRLVGKSVEETIGDFESLGKSPVEASQKLNEQYGYLTFAVYEQIKALEEQGRTDEAAELAQQAYKKAMDERTASLEANLGVLEKAWAGVAGVASKAWDNMLGLGREKSIEQAIAEARATIASLQSAPSSTGISEIDNFLPATNNQGAIADQELQIKRLEYTKDALDSLNDAAAEGVRLENERITASATWAAAAPEDAKKRKKLQDEENELRRAGIALGKDEKAIEEQIASLRANRQSKTGGGGGRSAGDAELASIRARIAAQDELLERLKIHGTETQKLTEGERIVLKLQEDLTGKLTSRQRATKELALEEAKRLVTAEKATQAEEDRLKREQAFTKEIDESRKARQKQVEEMLKSVEQMDKSNTTLREEIELIGKSRQEQARILIGREQQRLAVAELRLAELQRAADLGQSTTQELYAQQQIVDKIRERIALLENKDFAEGNAEAAKLIASQWDKTAKTIGDTLNDYIIGGGKSAAEYLERLFAALVLRPIVEAGVGSVMGLFGGGQGAAAQSGGFWGGLGNSGGGFTNWSGWGGNAARGFGNLGFGLYENGYESAGNALMGLSDSIRDFDTWLQDIPGFQGGIGSAAGYAGAIFQLFQGNYGSGIGSAIGTAIMPGIGTMLGGLLGGWIDGLDGSGDVHRGGTGHYFSGNSENYQSGPQSHYDATVGGALEGLALGVGASFDKFLSDFGLEGRAQVFTGWSDDFDGEGGSWGDLRINIQNAQGEWEELINWASEPWDSKWSPREFAPMEEGWAEYVTAVAQSYVEALQGLDLPDWASGLLGQVGDDASLEQINAVLGQLAAMRETLAGWQTYLVEFGNVGDAAFGALLESMGGFENLSSGVAAFVDLFYSDAEKLEMSQKQIAEQLAKFDLKMPMLDLSDETMDTAEEVKAAWRAMVEEALAAGEEGAELAAMLLNLGPAFAQTTDAAEAAAQAEAELAQARIDEQQRVIDALYSDAGISGDTIAQILRDGMLGRLTQDDVGAQLSAHIIDGIYNSIAGGFAQQITDTFTSGIITPLLQAAATGSAMSGVVSQASIDAVVGQARASVAALQAILDDPALQAAIAAINSTIKDLNVGSVAVPKPVARPSYSGGYSGGSSIKSQANEMISAWESVYNAILGSMEDLRDTILGTTQDSGNSFYEAQFAMLTAQARAGDKDAAEKLPELVDKLAEYAKGNSASLFDQNSSIAGYIKSLEDTQKYIAGFYQKAGGKLSDLEAWDTQSVYQAADMKPVNVPAKVIPTVDNSAMLNSLNSSSGNTALLAEMRAMRTELAAVKAELAAARSSAEDTAANTRNISRTLDEVTNGGDAMITREATA
ncbi:hypothetical protein E8K88_16340 [Lampropedia aestuarii]|uniref:Bacteriophage tail tape measure N-terminal domain-containing protein n=1 Tax=Lampropedia aestuarii TaxID=2562762 RepID=A0A4S5BJD6_9BURK|nr:phage tail length tape measure family protein [Lampropedia aestuarii]THJ30935.1 hypothetical protein E8K88_16340 [Lampropedia aestuarii]